jgi:exodeoxyribonuclease V alpha subunit
MGVGVSFVECNELDLLDELLRLCNELGGDFADLRVISMVKSGTRRMSTRSINDYFYQNKARGRQPERDGFALFEPVIWNTNNYELGLMNGTLGFVESVSEGLVIQWDDVGSKKIGEFKDMDRAYAITCHKAQGSQFKRIILPIFNSRLLDRTMLYTAVTRAQEQVVIVGDRSAFEKAVIAPPSTSVRRTGMHFLL